MAAVLKRIRDPYHAAQGFLTAGGLWQGVLQRFFDGSQRESALLLHKVVIGEFIIDVAFHRTCV